MATEKKRSKGRFLYLFDWNTKSRKKLFSNKSESSEVSSNGKENVDNMEISQYFLRELHENEDHSSFRGSGNFSCASSVNGEEGYGTKAPSLVARLMGLDSMPTTSCEASSISLYESSGVSNSYYPKGISSFQHEHEILDYGYAPKNVGGFPWSPMDPRAKGVHGRPIERFQTEVLPPKSAKPISITHHKLLSPIKSPAFVPKKDPAYIMEAAKRIIDSSPHETSRVNIPSISSPSSSFRLQDLKKRMDAAQRSSRLNAMSKTPKKSTSGEQTRGNPSGRSGNGSLFRNAMTSETRRLEGVKKRGKAVSVAVRDKTKVHRTEGSAYCDSRSQLGEAKQAKLKHKPVSTQKAGESRTSTIKSSSVLRQNNDKQNTVSQKDRSTSKTLISDQLPRKVASGDSRAGPSKIVSRVFVNVENGSKKGAVSKSAIDKKASLNVVNERGPSLNKMKSVPKKKQSSIRENVPDNSEERSGQHDHPSSGNELDVISFTFTSPIKKSGAQPLSPAKASGRNHHRLDADSSALNSQACDASSTSSVSGLSLIDSGSLSHLLEQKLKELTEKITPLESDSVMESFDTDSVSSLPTNSSLDVASTREYNEWSGKDQLNTTRDDDRSLSFSSKSSQKRQEIEDVEEPSVNNTRECKSSNRESDLGHHNISVPEYSISGSCMSSSTTSDFICEDNQEVTSCISTGRTSQWELEYIRHVLHYAGLKRYWSDNHYKIIDPAIFDLLENLISTSVRSTELCSRNERRILFDCISEIITSRYKRVFIGSRKACTKWEMLLQNDIFSEDVFKEISGLTSMETLILDEVVDRDMSNGEGKWVDFEIESLEEGIEIEKEIIASLVDELLEEFCI